MTRARHGLSLVAMVTVFCALLAILVMAYQNLWRGTSRNLFSIQEDRELINLARSALAEAQYLLQDDLDSSKQKWFDWFTTPYAAPEEQFSPALTQNNANAMTSNPEFLAYTAENVKLRRIVGVSPDGAGNAQGIIELEVTVKVVRQAPLHQAALTLMERRYFWLADAHGPFEFGGRRVEVSPTPVATAFKEVRP